MLAPVITCPHTVVWVMDGAFPHFVKHQQCPPNHLPHRPCSRAMHHASCINQAGDLVEGGHHWHRTGLRAALYSKQPLMSKPTSSTSPDYKSASYLIHKNKAQAGPVKQKQGHLFRPQCPTTQPVSIRRQRPRMAITSYKRLCSFLLHHHHRAISASPTIVEPKHNPGSASDFSTPRNHTRGTTVDLYDIIAINSITVVQIMFDRVDE